VAGSGLDACSPARDGSANPEAAGAYFRRTRRNLIRHCRPAIERLEDRCLLSIDPILEWNAVMIQADAVDHATGMSPASFVPGITRMLSGSKPQLAMLS
jgi:hypothetical protein